MSIEETDLYIHIHLPLPFNSKIKFFVLYLTYHKRYIKSRSRLSLNDIFGAEIKR